LGPARRLDSLEDLVQHMDQSGYMKLRSAVPTGRVKWYDATKGFGFVTSDEGGDVFLPKGALPADVADLRAGQRVEFGVVDSRKGAQALGVKVLEAPTSVAELRRRPAEELHGLVEDMINLLEAKVQPDLRRGRFPDKRSAQKVAQLMHAVAGELEV
jgi:CspA family cold shock protein